MSAARATASILFKAGPGLVPVESGPDQVAGSALYDRVGGVTRLVAVDSDGAVVGQCGAELGATRSGNANALDAVSRDGSRIAFVTPDPGGFGDPSCSDPRRLWLRTGSGEPVDVSRSRIGGDPALTAPTFAGMSRDGEVVYFTAQQRLTAEATSDRGLYRYEAATDELTFVTGPVIRALHVSDDGEVLYYFGDDYSIGIVDHGAVHPGLTPPVLGLSDGFGTAAPADGSSLVFRTTDALTSYDPHGYHQIYQLTRAGRELSCLSCRPDGQPPTDHAYLVSASTFGERSPAILPRNALTGGRAVFESPERLTSEDSNGAADVYLYDEAGPHLISSGVGTSDSYFAGASADGSDIFFATTEGLVAEDTDNSNDIYDARVGGGFDGGAHGEQPCQADACQGPPAGPPPTLVLGSRLDGSGNVAARTRASLTVGALSARQRRALARTGRTRLRVRVSGPGSVRAVATGRIRGRHVRVAVTRRVLKGRGGTVRLLLRLSKAARTELRNKSRLRLVIEVKYSKSKAKSRKVVMLRG